MRDVKTTFIRKVKRGPFSSTKLYSYLFSHTSCSKIYWQLTTSEKFRLSFYKMTILTNRILAIIRIIKASKQNTLLIISTHFQNNVITFRIHNPFIGRKQDICRDILPLTMCV